MRSTANHDLSPRFKLAREAIGLRRESTEEAERYQISVCFEVNMLHLLVDNPDGVARRCQRRKIDTRNRWYKVSFVT